MSADDADIEEELAKQAWVAIAGGRTLFMQGPGLLEAWVGMPLYDELGLTIMVNGGARIEGFAVELSGPGLELLEIVALDAYNLGGKYPFNEGEVAFERRSNTLVAVLPVAVLAYNGQYHSAQDGHSDPSESCLDMVHLKVRAEAKATGHARLIVRLRDLAGNSLDADEVPFELEVAPAPRLPLLPSDPLPDEAASSRSSSRPEARAAYVQRVMQLGACYSGNELLMGWLGFDGTWQDLGPLVLELAAQLGAQLTAKAWPSAVDVASLAAGGGVTLRRRNGSYVTVQHQAGETALEREYREYRERSGRGRPAVKGVPIEIDFSIRRPRTSAKRASLAAALDQIFGKAASHPAAIGGFAAPAGERHDALLPYEQLVGLNPPDRLPLESIRGRPRSPGWRVIVPHAALDAVEVCSGITGTELAAGLLVASSAADPFAMTEQEREVMERALLPAFSRARAEKLRLDAERRKNRP